MFTYVEKNGITMMYNNFFIALKYTVFSVKKWRIFYFEDIYIEYNMLRDNKFSSTVDDKMKHNSNHKKV